MSVHLFGLPDTVDPLLGGLGEQGREAVVMTKAAGYRRAVTLRGKVTEILPVRGPHPHLRWQVVLKVEAIDEGEFASPEFRFTVHSPIKSGVTAGSRLVLRLRQAGESDYVVDSIEPWRE